MMKRLTGKISWDEARENLKNEMGYSHIWNRLHDIEDILGDEYSLEKLKEMVDAEKRIEL